MAVLIGGIGSSHAPSIAYAYDAGHAEQPVWKPLFEAYQPVKQWLRDQQVDTLIVVYNDHLHRFQFDAYPTFALGVAESMPVADEGEGPRPFPNIPGDPDLAWHLAKSLVHDEFDLTVCQDIEMDHGVMTVLPLIADTPWPYRVIPLAVNVIQEPLPTPRRCARLGEAIGRAVRSYGGDRRVVVMATGGLSHQLHGPDFGFTNPDWDNRFMDLLETRPEVLAEASHQDYMDRGGTESVEMMMWLSMRMALGAPQQPLKRVHRHYWAPMLTGYGLLTLETPQ